MPSTSGLRPDVARALRTLLDTLRGLGYSATFTSGYRSSAKQRQLYDAWRAGKSRYPVAPPGTSSHNYGLAVDVASNAPDAILRFAADVAGLVWFGPNDRVHFDPYGPAAWRAIVRAGGAKSGGFGAPQTPSTGD